MNSEQYAAGDAEEFREDPLSQWKSELKAFFDTDREKLRRLIMQLEECGWQTQGQGIGGAVEEEGCPAGSEYGQPEPTGPEVRSESRPPLRMAEEGRGPNEELKRQRLTALAETIEHRLRAADTRLR